MKIRPLSTSRTQSRGQMIKKASLFRSAYTWVEVAAEIELYLFIRRCSIHVYEDEGTYLCIKAVFKGGGDSGAVHISIDFNLLSVFIFFDTQSNPAFYCIFTLVLRSHKKWYIWKILIPTSFEYLPKIIRYSWSSLKYYASMRYRDSTCSN